MTVMAVIHDAPGHSADWPDGEPRDIAADLDHEYHPGRMP